MAPLCVATKVGNELSPGVRVENTSHAKEPPLLGKAGSGTGLGGRMFYAIVRSQNRKGSTIRSRESSGTPTAKIVGFRVNNGVCPRTENRQGNSAGLPGGGRLNTGRCSDQASLTKVFSENRTDFVADPLLSESRVVSCKAMASTP
jgi:hypothetical protein